MFVGFFVDDLVVDFFVDDLVVDFFVDDLVVGFFVDDLVEFFVGGLVVFVGFFFLFGGLSSVFFFIFFV